LGSSIFGRRDEQRLREELEEHLALQTAENVRAGLQPADARRQAMLKLGAMEAIKEDYREEQGLPFFDLLQQDLRYAVRQVRRAPFVTAMATLSLAVGIGANAAIFTIVDRVLLQSLPVSDPDELVFVTDQRSRRERSPRFSYPFYVTLRDTTALNGVAARFVLPVNVSTDEQAVRPRGELVSGNYFSVLGAGIQLGRPLTAADDLTPGAHPVAVISDGFWRRSFAADPSALGRTVRINNYPFTLVGVTAPSFNGTEVGLPTDLWLPLAMQREIGRDFLTESRTNWLEMIGRLKPGANLERAGAELTAYLDARGTSSGRPEARQLILLPAGKGSSPVRRETGPVLRVLLALAGLALLLCCLNVASLLVVRSEARQREMAVRLALGARRATLIRQSLTETLVLAALGGTAGLLVAPWAASLLVASQPDRLAIDASLDLRVFLFGLAVSVVTGLILGQAPLFASGRIGLTQAFGNSPPAVRTLGRLTARDIMVACQIAASLVMLIGAALLTQSLRTLSAVDPGFRADGLLLVSMDPGSAGYNAGRVESFWRAALERVARIPGVQSASLGGTVPLAPSRQRQPLRNPASGEMAEIDTNFVGPRYFQTLDIPLLRGREFDESDGTTSRRVAIVNQRLAGAFWPDQDPVGKTMAIGRPGSPAVEIVGVVKDVKYRDLRVDADPMIYLPMLQAGSRSAMTLHVRSTGDPHPLIAAIRRQIRDLDASLPLFGITSLDEQVTRSLGQLRQAAALSAGFGVLALLLSGIGVYSVTALAVSRRTREIGIRTALGARPAQIVLVIGRRGIALVAAGLAAGIAGSLWFSRLSEALLYGVTAGDRATFAAMAALLAVVSLSAVAIGVRTATRLDAVRAIRAE
jgi:predicted permease